MLVKVGYNDEVIEVKLRCEVCWFGYYDNCYKKEKCVLNELVKKGLMLSNGSVKRRVVKIV